jgi:hypothetical protein
MQELLESGYLTEVHKFSKFIHGSATLMPDMVQVRTGRPATFSITHPAAAALCQHGLVLRRLAAALVSDVVLV